MIETWYNCDKKSNKKIAKLLHKSERTIRREINRVKVIVRNYDWTEKEEYSARAAQRKYEYGIICNKTVLFTLTEIMRRQEIIMELPNKETKTIANTLDKIERRYRSKFYSKFKSITFDN